MIDSRSNLVQDLLWKLKQAGMFTDSTDISIRPDVAKIASLLLW